MAFGKSKTSEARVAPVDKNQENVNQGHVYVDDKGTEVIPFHVDLHLGRVRFAPIGRSREMELSIDEFLEDYDYVGLQSAHAEKPKSKTASAR